MLTYPKSGDNILKWAKDATREINANHLQNGIGVKVTRGPNGTNLVVLPGDKNKVKGEWFMPFDVIDGGETALSGSNDRNFEVMTCGGESNILYTIGKESRRIPPWESLYRKGLTVTLPVEEGGKVYFVAVFQYESSESGSESGSGSGSESGSEEEGDGFPINYIINTEGDLTDAKICDDDGYKMIPFAYVEKLKDPEDDEGSEEEEEEPEAPPIDGAYRTMFTQNEKNYALVQMYHGDIHLEMRGTGGLSTCSVGTVTGGAGGTFTVWLEQWDGTEDEVRVCACDLACTSMIPNGTKIIAHPIETRYVGE